MTPGRTNLAGAAAGRPHGGRILRNSLFGMAARVMDMAMRMVIVAVIARYLGATGFGELAFVSAAAAFVQLFTDFGLEPILVRDMNAAGSDRTRVVGEMLALRGLMGCVALAAMAAVGALSGWPRPLFLAMLVSSATAVTAAVQTVMLGVIRAHERMEYDAVTTFVYQGVALALTLAAIRIDGGLVGIVLAQLASETIKLALLAGWVQRRFQRLRLVWDARQMGYYLREAVPLVGVALASVVSFRLNVLFLKAWSTPEDVAMFDASQRILISITIIPIMAVLATFPALCRMAGADRPALRRAYAAIFKYLLVMGLFVTVVLAFWAEPILRLMYGASFAASAGAMRWLALSTVAGFMIPLTNFMMTAIGRQGPSVAGVVSGVAVNVLVNLVAVPSHGHVGAAAGFAVGTVVAALVNGGLVRAMVGPAGLAGVTWRPLAAASLMAAVGAFVGTGSGLRAAVGLTLSVAVFAASLFVSGAITPGEVATLRALRPPPDAGAAAPDAP